MSSTQTAPADPSSINPLTTITGQTSAGQYGFVDPYGTTGQLQNALYGQGGAISGGPMGTYNANANGVMGQIAGLSGPLQQTLSGIANYQANNALNNVGSNFANMGALGSGAGAQAMGNAIAQPFAQAQAQLQGSQLQAASGALNNLMGVSGGAYSAGLGQGGNLMEHTSGLVAPQTMTNPAYTQATTIQDMMLANSMSQASQAQTGKQNMVNGIPNYLMQAGTTGAK